jgi:hypothetical protein
MQTTQDATAAGSWPAWSSDDGYEQLAGYVNVRTLEGLDLIAFEAEKRRLLALEERGGKVADANHATAAELFGRLASKAYRYVNEPWSTSERQGVRHARWIDRSGGTCLDFALLLATMAFEAEIAPIVVLGKGRIEGGDDHAFLLLDLERRWGERGTASSGWSADLAGGFRSFAGKLPPSFNDALANGRLVPVDATAATAGPSSTFEDAIERGRKELTAFDDLVLVDVLHQLTHGIEAFPPPHPQASPAISRSLPSFPVFKHYASRSKLEQQLQEISGRVVLWGRQGTGKSMLAHQLAASKADGCGWFLAATDASTLVTALAHAFARENARDAVDLEDDATRKDYASSAVKALNDAPEPWVVVLDNANGDPAELAPWLPSPSRQRDQLLIVTTTNAEWRSRPDVLDVGVTELDDPDVLEEIGDPRLVRLSRGRPLLANSFARLQAATEGLSTDLDALLARDDVTDADGPRVLWQEVHSRLDPATEATAWLLAWLPPDQVPVALLAELRGSHDHGVERLEQLGLVSFQGARDVVGIHRLYVAAIRETLRERHDDRLASILTVLGSKAGLEHLDKRGDRATVVEIAYQLQEDSAAASSTRRLAPALREAARLQELHGMVADSSRTYDELATRLEAELGIPPGSATAGDLPPPSDLDDLLADALHGRARAPYQNPTSDRETMERVLADCRRAVALKERLAESLDGDERKEAKIGAARSRALVGLIQRQLARLLPEDEARAELEAALEVIERSADERREYLGDDSPEVARSVFNLGGSRIGLAQRDAPERVAHHLDHAAEAYGQALATRLRIYPRKVHPHIAACRNGLALVAYYRAILQPGLDEQQRVKSLRDATVEAERALHDREDLDGLLDGPDTTKSGALLAKILLARQELAKSGRRSTDVAAEAEQEIARLTALRVTEQG